MRAALIDPLGQYAGNHHYTDQLARGLSHAGVQVTVYVHDGDVDLSPDRPYEYLEPFHDIYGSRPVVMRGGQFLKCLTVTFSGIFGRRTDIVHVQMWAHDMREILQIAIARMMRKKVVVSAHEIKGWSSRRSSVASADPGHKSNDGGEVTRRFEWVLSHTDAIVVHNRHSYDMLMARYKPRTPVAVIPLPHVSQTGSGATLPDRADARRRLELPEDKTIFLFFGNCRYEKGLDLALRALAELKADNDDMLLVAAGKMKADEEAYFRGMAGDLGLGRLLRMDIGLVSDVQAIDYFRASNAVVVPYRDVSESGVAITAATFGRAILASDLPPLLEATEGGQLGLHFKNGDFHDLAALMKRALSMTDQLDAMGARASDKVRHERDPDVIGAQMFQLYQGLLRPRIE